MAFIEIGNEGSLSGTTAVDVVGTPAAATRRLVRSVSINNRDTVAQTIIIKKVKSSTEQWRTSVVLQPSEEYIYDRLIVLDATDEKLTAEMGAAATTTNCQFDTAYADAS